MTIQKGGALLATLILNQTALLPGDVIRGILNFSNAVLRCLQVRNFIEISQESPLQCIYIVWISLYYKRWEENFWYRCRCQYGWRAWRTWRGHLTPIVYIWKKSPSIINWRTTISPHSLCFRYRRMDRRICRLISVGLSTITSTTIILSFMKEISEKVHDLNDKEYMRFMMTSSDVNTVNVSWQLVFSFVTQSAHDSPKSPQCLRWTLPLRVLTPCLPPQSIYNEPSVIHCWICKYV